MGGGARKAVCNWVPDIPGLESSSSSDEDEAGGSQRAPSNSNGSTPQDAFDSNGAVLGLLALRGDDAQKLGLTDQVLQELRRSTAADPEPTAAAAAAAAAAVATKHTAISLPVVSPGMQQGTLRAQAALAAQASARAAQAATAAQAETRPAKKARHDAAKPEPRRHGTACIDTLREWLNTNVRSPYPTKQQREQLAAATEMTVMQVGTWLTRERSRVWRPAVRRTFLSHGPGAADQLQVRPRRPIWIG